MLGQNSRDVGATGSTGTICQRSGPYRCNSHTQIIVFYKRGDRFTACPARGHATTWQMVRS